MTTKTCKACKVTKDHEEFYRNRGVFSVACKECTKEAARINKRERKLNDIDGSRNRRLIQKYGITSVDYRRMYEEQNGQCHICKTSYDYGTLCVDHNHSTLQVRGLLCSPCNLAIGYFKERQDSLAAAIDYLQKYSK